MDAALPDAGDASLLDAQSDADGSTSDAGADARADGAQPLPECSGAPVPRVLLLFDVSNSMTEPWLAGKSRLDLASEGVHAAVAAFGGALEIGTLFFPTAACVPFLPPPPGGAVAPLEMAPQIAFRSATGFIEAWDAQAWPPIDPTAGLGTPLQEVFDRAAVALAGGPDVPIAVVLITDGEGNCMSDAEVTGIPTDTIENRVTAWRAAGIRTHIVGFVDAQSSSWMTALVDLAGTTPLVPDSVDALPNWLGELFEELRCAGSP